MTKEEIYLELKKLEHPVKISVFARKHDIHPAAVRIVFEALLNEGLLKTNNQYGSYKTYKVVNK